MMNHNYYILFSIDNSLKARAVMLTPEECTQRGLYDGWSEDGDIRKNTPDRYLDGFDTKKEALEALRDIRAGRY
jgi:hypothetical protein